MYCRKCGSVIPEQAKFCPKCGEAVLRPPVRKKKSHKKAGLIIFLIFIMGIGGGIFAFRNNIMAFLSGNKKNEDVYSEAVETLENTLGSSEYLHAGLSQRKEIMLDVLSNMEDDGIIKKDCTSYYEEDNYIYYQYINGVKGLITLENFDDHTVGLRSETLNGEYDKKYPICRPDANIAGKYNKNPSALVMMGLGQPDYEDNIYKLSKSWTSDGLHTDVDNDVTVKEMAEKLAGYDFIYILLHGNYQPKVSDTQLIFIKEKRTPQKDNDYAADLNNHNLLHNPTQDGTYYIITGDFFSDHYSAGKKLDNSIVFVGCCRGYKTNDNLVRQFADSGAKAVIGATETVWTDYEIRIINEFVCRLLCGNTVNEALDHAKSAVGKDELDYYERLYGDESTMSNFWSGYDHSVHQGVKRTNPQFKLYKNENNDGTAVLVTLKENLNPSGATKYLDEIEIIDADMYTGNEGDSFVYPIGQHQFSRGNTTTDNISYEHGIEGWVARWNYKAEASWAYSTFNLGKNFNTLTGQCKLIQSYNTTDFDTTLEIWGDNRLLQSYHLTPETIPFDINLNVSNCDNLKVYFYDNISKCGGTSFGLIDMKLE